MIALVLIQVIRETVYGFFHLHKIFYTLHKRQTMLHHVSGMSKVFYMNTDQILEQLDACYGECKIFCVNEKIHTKKEVASVE